MKNYTRCLSSSIIIGLGILTLTGHGGDPESSPTTVAPTPVATNEMGVYAGYSGSLDWTIADSAGPGGGVGGGDGAGGVGIGGALGQFQNVSVSVKTMKGDLVGRANVGADGLVTLRTGGNPGPFLIEVEGRTGGQYFDEGKGAVIPFGPGESLRSYVDVVDKNLGVTFATEAVYQYLTAAGFSVPANPPTAKAISDASAVIREAINAQVDPKYAVSDLKRLPALISASSGTNSLPDNPRGLYGVLAAGFAKQAASFNPQLTSPGLDAVRQFASDLNDGVINGRDSKGVAVAEASKLTYDPATLRQALSTATASAAVQYGVPQTQLSKVSVLDFGVYCLTANCLDEKSLLLRSDGTIDSVKFNNDYSIASTQTLVTGAVGLLQLNDAAIIRFADGSGAVLGLNAYGQLGVGDQLTQSVPTKVESLRSVTSAASGDRHAIARLADGTVVASGDNSKKQLGAESVALPNSKVFVKVNLNGQAISVEANSNSNYAVMSDGSVMAWGEDIAGSLGNGVLASPLQLPKPVLIASSAQLGSVISLVADDYSGVAALRTDGSVFGWGAGSSSIFPGVNSNTYFAKTIPGLPPASKIACDGYYFYALARNGSVWAWGDGSFSSVSQISGLPKIVDLTRFSSGTVAWAADGRRFILTGATFFEFPF
jgi:hypothetical protein